MGASSSPPPEKHFINFSPFLHLTTARFLLFTSLLFSPRMIESIKDPKNSNNNNPFRSSRLVYRAIDSPQDDEIFHELYRDPSTYRHSYRGLEVPPSRKRSAFIREYHQKATLGVLICVDDGDEKDAATTTTTPIGALSLDKPGGTGNAHHRKAELTICIALAYQNKGYGTEAIQWSLDWAFDKANLHRVEFDVLSYNYGAIKLYKKLGVKVESLERESIWHDNAWHGVIGMGIYSLLQHGPLLANMF